MSDSVWILFKRATLNSGFQIRFTYPPTPNTLNTIKIFINTYTLETLFKNPQLGCSNKPTDKPI